MPPPLPIRLTGVTHYHQAAGVHPNPRQVPAGVEMVELVTGGRGWVLHEAAYQQVTPGTLIWHVAGDLTIGRSDFANPYRCLAVTFAVADTGQRRCPRLSRWPETDEVRAFTREVVSTYVDEHFERQALMLYAYSRLLFQARRHHHGRLTSDAPVGLKRALDRLERDFGEDLAVADLAADAGWSASHLHQVFREHVGMSPHHYLIQRRIRAAKEKLASADHPIKQVAAACGYAYPASFCRQFRQETGLTPGQYRQRHAYEATLANRR